jgi:hypothetical protein
MLRVQTVHADAKRDRRTKAIDIADFGAKGDGKTDSRAAIQRAFDHASARGLDVFIPAGTFIHSGTLAADGIKIFGAGEASILRASTYGQEALFLKGNSVALTDLRLVGVGGPRLTTDASQKIVVQGSRNFTIERVRIERTTTGGMKINGASRGRIADNVVEDTHADSIHMTRGSHDILVERNRISRSGDDAIAVVSYGGATGTLTRGIVIRNNEVYDNTGGRGIAVVGGGDVVIENNLVHGSSSPRGGAGIYLAAESSYNTQSVHNVRVTGNRLIDVGGLNSGHGAIHVYNSQGSAGLVNDGIVIAGNEIINPRKAGIAITGSGEQHIAAYDNTLVGGQHGLIVNACERATTSTTKPVDARR